jgi:2-polyprenyl-3-methyl-5-hydroxy-6-metoxy-1,4-benzoquinol methylase
VSRLERLSETYAEHHRSRRGRGFVYAEPERTELFRRRVGGPGLRVLDLGCRDGALSRSYLDGNEVVGIDADREALAEAERLGIEVHWGDVEEPLPWGNASFDAVVIGELLEHTREPQSVVAEAKRVLRPGGMLVGSVPNGYRLKNRLRFLVGRSLEDDPTALHLFDPARIRGFLDGLDEPRLEFVAGRLVRLHPRLMANVVVFSGRKPR